MDIKKQLENTGLNQSEIEIYLYLLKNGISTPPQISKGTGIARTNCYNVLRNLKEKDLVKDLVKSKRKVYIANNPESFLINLDKKREAIKNIIPDLQTMHRSQTNKPVILFYDGLEEIKEIYLQTLSAKIVVKGIASTEQLFSLDRKFFENYRKQLKTRGIIFKDIITSASGQKSIDEVKKDMGALVDSQILPKEYDDIYTDILIWNDNIALITTTAPIFGTVIKSDHLARAFNMMFDIIWKNLDQPSNN